jgi:hypothetical protein
MYAGRRLGAVKGHDLMVATGASTREVRTSGLRPLDSSRWTRFLWYAPIVATGAMVVLWGPLAGAVAVAGLLGVVALLFVPGWVWVAAAIVSALLSRTLSSFGLLPNVAQFADFGFVSAGLAAVALRRAGPWTAASRRLVAPLAALLVVIWTSSLIHGTGHLRALVVFMLWAEPFALLLILVLEPPPKRHRRTLLACFGLLVVLQVPFALWQAATKGLGDPVQGTLIGSGAGAHLMAGVTTLGGLALMNWGYGRSFQWGVAATLGAAPLILLLPVLADAKQVVLALPAAALVLLALTRKITRKVAISAALAAVLAYLVLQVPQGRTAVNFLDRAGGGKSGKLVGFEVALDETRRYWANWLFGLGPAQGLSRAAFLTTAVGNEKAITTIDGRVTRAAQIPKGPLQRVLEPATVPVLAHDKARRVASGTSFNSPLSSGLGVFSDTGILGSAVFAWLLIWIGAALIHAREHWLARAALAGWALSIPLAFTFDWWEEPPFMLPLALLTGLALIAAVTDRQRDAPDGLVEPVRPKPPPRATPRSLPLLEGRPSDTSTR